MLFFFIVFILGLCVGSFLNVLIYRLPRGLKFVKGRSFCPECKRKINWFNNVPLISFILLKGRCRYCHSPISLRYPVVELLTGVLFVLGAFSQLGNLSHLSHLSWTETILTWVLFSALVVIFFIDLEHQIIPDEVVVPFIILFSLRLFFPLPTSFSSFSLLASLPRLAVFGEAGRFSPLFSGIGSFLFMLFIYIITKGQGMGFGDVKLAFLIGLVLGYPKIIVALYLAFLTGGIVGVILILVRKAKFGQKIAFGPFLCLATTVTYLWGENFLEIIKKFLFLY